MAFCNTQLAVKHEGAAHWTEALEDVRDELAALKRKSEIAELDREWELERETFMVTGQNGVKSLPGKTSSGVGMVFVVVFGIFWTMFAGAMFPPMALFGIVFIAVGVIAGLNGMNKASKYEAAQRRYRKRRRELGRLDD